MIEKPASQRVFEFADRLRKNWRRLTSTRLLADQIEQIGHEIAALERQLGEAERKYDNWLPTSENINALPEGPRRFIHDLETRCDPSGVYRENILRRDEMEGLQSELTRLRAENERLEQKRWSEKAKAKKWRRKFVAIKEHLEYLNPRYNYLKKDRGRIKHVLYGASVDETVRLALRGIAGDNSKRIIDIRTAVHRQACELESLRSRLAAREPHQTPTTMKEQIRQAMQKIAQRRQGKPRLVYNKNTKTIDEVGRDGSRKPWASWRALFDQYDHD